MPVVREYDYLWGPHDYIYYLSPWIPQYSQELVGALVHYYSTTFFFLSPYHYSHS